MKELILGNFINADSKIIVLFGRPASGKTTICKMLINELNKTDKETIYFDLEQTPYSANKILNTIKNSNSKYVFIDYWQMVKKAEKNHLINELQGLTTKNHLTIFITSMLDRESVNENDFPSKKYLQNCDLIKSLNVDYKLLALKKQSNLKDYNLQIIKA